MNIKNFIFQCRKVFNCSQISDCKNSLKTNSDYSPSTSQGDIVCRKLNVTYNSYTAIQDLSGTFHAGSLTAVIGPNGGGKSTLLKTIKGFVKPSSGTFTHKGVASNEITYLSQRSEIDRSFPLPVRDVVAMGLCAEAGFFKCFNRIQCDKILHALERVGLLGYADRSLYSLSGGQFQRVLFARMILQNSPIVLLDEPFAAIDSSTMEDLAQLLCEWQQQGRTIIVVLHDLEIVRDFFPKTLILARQSIAWGDTKETLTLDNLRKARSYLRDWSNDQNELVFPSREYT